MYRAPSFLNIGVFFSNQLLLQYIMVAIGSSTSSGSSGMDKMLYGQNGMDKMVWIKYYG